MFYFLTILIGISEDMGLKVRSWSGSDGEGGSRVKDKHSSKCLAEGLTLAGRLTRWGGSLCGGLA